MLANRTGNSFRRKMNDFCSDAFNPERKALVSGTVINAIIMKKKRQK
jgi:hypothetical protein